MIAPPLITNEALSSSAASVIAHQEVDKYTDLFGYNWRYENGEYGLGMPNMPMQTVPVNLADIGKPPPPLSYYFGAAGWYCLNSDPHFGMAQPISAQLPPIPCDTIFDDHYKPWIQIPKTAAGGCHPMFGWDPPVALTKALRLLDRLLRPLSLR